MSNTENIVIPPAEIVEVESGSSTSNSVEKMFDKDDEASSEESVESRKENPRGGVSVVSVARTPLRTSFETLTVPVGVPVNPTVPRTMYAGITSTGLNVRDVPGPSVPSVPSDDSTSDDLGLAPKTKKQITGDFVLRANQAGAERCALTVDLDRSRFRMFCLPVCPPITDYFVPIPVEHFISGLALPLDPAFCDFLHSVCSQPAHIHPNGVRYFISLTILCRRIGVEISDKLLRTFFSVLRMNNLTLSLRPRKNVVTLFEPAPNKLSHWRDHWVCVESNLGFPFYPKRKSLLSLSKTTRRMSYSESDRKFLDYVKSELGSDPKRQTKVFCTRDLIENSSRYSCGIGGMRADERRRELGLDDDGEYPMWRLHPNRVFSTECAECSDLRSLACLPRKDKEMASRFSKRRDFMMNKREKAIGKSAPNPARAVEKTSLTAAPVSSEEVPSSTSRAVDLDGDNVPLITRTERSKGKRIAGASSRKRSLEETEVEAPPKRRTSESRLPAVDEVDETLAIVQHTPGSSRGQGSSSARVPDYLWTQEGFKVPKSRRDLFKLSQDIQKATPPLTNLMLSDPIIGKYFGGAVLSRAMDSDTYAHARGQSIGVEDSLGNIGVFLSQACAYISHMGNMAASANTSKTMLNSAERKCLKLESALSSQSKELESSNSKLKSSEENLALVIEQKEKQSEELKSCQNANEDLRAQFQEMEKKLQESEAKHQAAADRVSFLESEEHSANIIQGFRQSEAYEDEVFEKSNSFFDRGCAHVLRNFHECIADKTRMVHVFLGNYADPRFREGCHFVPYTEAQLAEIKEIDEEAGRTWEPPKLSSPNFDDLVREIGRAPDLSAQPTEDPAQEASIDNQPEST